MTEQTEKIVKKFGDEDLSDVCLVVGNADFHVHKQVLACQSKVFKAMFYGAVKQENEKRIEIDDADPLAFQRILEMTYNHKMSDVGFLLCRYSGSSDAFWEQSTALWKLIDRFDLPVCQETFIESLGKYCSQKVSSFLVARLPDEPKSLKAIDFMQNNNFSYRISTNSTLLNVLMSSSGAKEAQLAAEQLAKMFEPVKVKIEDACDEDDEQKPKERSSTVKSVENRPEVNAQLNEQMEVAQDHSAAGEELPALLIDKGENNVKGPLFDVSSPINNDFPENEDNEDNEVLRNQGILGDFDDTTMDFDNSTLDCNENDSMDEDLMEEHEGHEEKETDKKREEEERDENESEEKDEESEEDAARDDEEDGTNPKKKRIRKKTSFPRVSDSFSSRLSYVCPVKNCPYSYNTFNRLDGHMKAHTDKEDFFCDVCKKDFSSRSAAARHVQRRVKKECCACNKAFASCQALLFHLRWHSGEKPFGCEYCEKRFTQLSQLKIHERIHTGEKPYSCKKCSAKFISSTALNYHMKTNHSSIKK